MATRKSYRVFSLFMALLILVSSTGFSIDLHFCQGQLKSFSLWGDAKPCHGMEVPVAVCSLKKNTKKSCCQSKAIQQINKDIVDCEKDCCSNQKIEISADLDADKIKTTILSYTSLSFVVAYVQAFAPSLPDVFKSFVPHQNYRSPLLFKDLAILIQQFLL